MQKYKVMSNFLQYYSLLSAIPQEWKSMLKQECLPPSTEYEPLAIKKLTCKTINFTILYFIMSTFLLQLQRENSLSAALAFKKDAKSTHFLFIGCFLVTWWVSLVKGQVLLYSSLFFHVNANWLFLGHVTGVVQ